VKSPLGTMEYFKISAFPSSLCLRHTASRQGLDRNAEIRRAWRSCREWLNL